MSAADRERHAAAAHAMQTGVAYTMEKEPNETKPKHLRVGVNVALCDQSALVKLLVAKGILTMDEYEKAIADEMEAEVKRYEKRLAELFGADEGVIKLA